MQLLKQRITHFGRFDKFYFAAPSDFSGRQTSLDISGTAAIDLARFALRQLFHRHFLTGRSAAFGDVLCRHWFRLR